MDDTRRGRQKTKIAATASSCPTVANDAANGHLCDIYDIYIYQWYWGISELLVWFTQQGENNFQGRNLLWKLLIRHICVCEQQSLPHATRKVPHNSEFIVFTTAFLFSHFFLPGSQQFLTVQTRERQTWCAGLVSTMTCLCVCVCECVLGLLAFRALWSDILINCTLACSNGPTCNRAESRGQRATQFHASPAQQQPACLHLIKVSFIAFACTAAAALLPLLCLLFYG